MTVSSITPNTVPGGVGALVTITGSGFTSDMGVSFENGTGFSPVANIQSVNANEITAFVTVKNGGNGRDPLWDVRVGSAVRPDVLTVVP